MSVRRLLPAGRGAGLTYFPSLMARAAMRSASEVGRYPHFEGRKLPSLPVVLCIPGGTRGRGRPVVHSVHGCSGQTEPS